MASFEGARREGFEDSCEGARMQKGIQGMFRAFWNFLLTDPAVAVEVEALRDPSTDTVLGDG
jgi:hypothetical protein